MVECRGCERQAGYNRAIVEVDSSTELAGLCVECERDAFGHTLEVGSFRSDECALCPRDGHYALPTWDPERVRENGRLVNRVDYEVDDATPTLCDEHLMRLIGSPTTAVATERTRTRR